MQSPNRKSIRQKRAATGLPLRENAFFAPLSPEVVAHAESFVYHREYEPRQIIYFPDDPCDHVYWVRRGRAKITRMSGDGRELTFRHLLPGDLFGEECLTGLPKRNAYGEAMENSLLCLMRADDFLRITREEPEMAFALAQHLCRRTQEVELILSETVFKTVRNRIAAGLLRLYNRSGRDNRGLIRITHQEIANLVGSTRETTTAVLHDLRKNGLLEMANRRLTILDPVALEHLARSNS